MWQDAEYWKKHSIGVPWWEVKKMPREPQSNTLRFLAICTVHGRLLEHEAAPVSGWSTHIVDVDLSWSHCPEEAESQADENDCNRYWEVVLVP